MTDERKGNGVYQPEDTSLQSARALIDALIDRAADLEPPESLCVTRGSTLPLLRNQAEEAAGIGEIGFLSSLALLQRTRIRNMGLAGAIAAAIVCGFFAGRLSATPPAAPIESAKENRESTEKRVTDATVVHLVVKSY